MRSDHEVHEGGTKATRKFLRRKGWTLLEFVISIYAREQSTQSVDGRRRRPLSVLVFTPETMLIVRPCRTEGSSNLPLCPWCLLSVLCGPPLEERRKTQRKISMSYHPNTPTPYTSLFLFYIWVCQRKIMARNF